MYKTSLISEIFSGSKGKDMRPINNILSWFKFPIQYYREILSGVSILEELLE
jgi:hypothetical protein